MPPGRNSNKRIKEESQTKDRPDFVKKEVDEEILEKSFLQRRESWAGKPRWNGVIGQRCGIEVPACYLLVGSVTSGVCTLGLDLLVCLVAWKR